MIDIIRQIRDADRAGLYYLALFGTLTLPDICAALESPNNRTNSAKYRAWYTKWVMPRFALITAKECYQYRCSVLHQGKGQPEKRQRFDRIVFVEPIPKTPRPILNFPPMQTDDGKEVVQAIDLQLFMIEVTHAASTWLDAMQGTEPFETNAAGMLRCRPNYPLAYSRGHSVIA